MIEIQTIHVDKYDTVPGHSLPQHVGMIDAQDAFDQLEAHLKKIGLLPDEYFSLSFNLKGELPDFSEAVCHTNWGGSEGIYIDIELKYYQDRQPKVLQFATGKTLGDSGDAFLRMSRIAAECSMMLNGRGSIVRVSEKAYQPFWVAEQGRGALEGKIHSAATRAASQTPGEQAMNASSPEL